MQLLQEYDVDAESVFCGPLSEPGDTSEWQTDEFEDVLAGAGLNTVRTARCSVFRTPGCLFRCLVHLQGARYLVPGARYLIVPGTWYLVPGTRYLLPRVTWYKVTATRCLVQGT